MGELADLMQAAMDAWTDVVETHEVEPALTDRLAFTIGFLKGATWQVNR